MSRYYVLHLNPEPWAIGDVSAGRKDGYLTGRISPNPNLAAFQAAVREEMEGVAKLPEGRYKLTFYLWREQARYIDTADRIRQRNQADATNMQKGLEDALQGVLFDNDRDVADIRTVIIEQGPRVHPCIVIEAAQADRAHTTLSHLPYDILERIDTEPEPTKSTDRWADGTELF